MKDFIQAHQAKLKGVLSCFDRMLFRGYLPLQYGQAMAGFLQERKIPFGQLKPFLLRTSGELKGHAQRMAKESGRPYRYLETSLPMEKEARAMAERDGIEDGLVCVFARLELSRTFTFSCRQPCYVRSSRRKCVHLYYYFMDREFGLIHLKLQTWFPLTMQIYVNGQEWLSRKLKKHGIGFTKLDNVFVEVEDFERAQAFADRLPSLPWPRILDRWTKLVNPSMKTLLRGNSYYWVSSQMEYATDVIFKSRSALAGLYPRLLNHALLCYGAKDVMTFLGRKLRSNFQGEVTADLHELTTLRIPGARIRHRVKENWLKMYDKAGLVLRVETVINNPGEFRVRRRVRRKGKQKMEWARMLKGVAYLFRYRDVSRSANSRYLDGLAVVNDPTARVREVERITSPKRVTSNRTAKAFNPLARSDVELFQAFMNGGHNLRGFRNSDIRANLARTRHLSGLGPDEKRQSAKVSRIFQRFHAHGLIAKVPHSRKWRATCFGRRVMASSIQLKELSFPELLARAA